MVVTYIAGSARVGVDALEVALHRADRHVQPISSSHYYDGHKASEDYRGSATLLAGRTPPGGGREPVGEGGDEVTELVRPLDDERPVERREQRGQPVEPLRTQLDAEPGCGLRVRAFRGRQLRHDRDAGREPGADLLDRGLDAQGHLMPVRGLGESGEDVLRRVEPGGRLERAGQGPGVHDAIEPERPVLADAGIRTGHVPAARVGDEPVRVQGALAAPAVTGGVPDRDRPAMA